MIRKRDATAWPGWREEARKSMLANFTKSLCCDEAALLAALQQSLEQWPG